MTEDQLGCRITTRHYMPAWHNLTTNGIDMNSTFCAWPWFHQHVLTDGGINPCSQWGPAIPDLDYSSFFHSKYMQDLRHSFKNNIPGESCHKCLNNEKIKGSSQRTFSFDMAKLLEIDLDSKPLVRSQEVNLSNVCNVKCRTCNQHRSTKWIGDAAALGEKPVKVLNSGWELTDVQARDIKRLQFLGGEPLLHQDEIVRTLKKVKSFGDLQNLTLFINSNITVPLSDELIDLMLMMKKVGIGCSIDGIGPLNEYIRSDTIWSDVISNLNQIKMLHQSASHILFNIACLYSVYNAHAYVEILDFANEFSTWVNPIMLRIPEQLNARNLPRNYKDKLLDRYANFPRYQNKLAPIISHLVSDPTIDEHDWLQQFVSYNEFLDKRREVRLADAIPELASLLEASR